MTTWVRGTCAYQCTLKPFDFRMFWFEVGILMKVEMLIRKMKKYFWKWYIEVNQSLCYVQFRRYRVPNDNCSSRTVDDSAMPCQFRSFWKHFEVIKKYSAIIYITKNYMSLDAPSLKERKRGREMCRFSRMDLILSKGIGVVHWVCLSLPDVSKGKLLFNFSADEEFQITHEILGFSESGEKACGTFDQLLTAKSPIGYDLSSIQNLKYRNLMSKTNRETGDTRRSK